MADLESQVQREPEAADAQPQLRVLFRDARLLIVDKPSGLLVHRGWGRDEVTAVDLAAEIADGPVHPVHRLDRATSGILVFALDPEATRVLQSRWHDGVDKRYLALVRGRVVSTWTSAVREVDHPIPKTEDGPRIPAVSSMRALADAEAARCALVEVRPHTGRLHQVRRHLKHLFAPVVGDVRYGDGRVNRAFRTEWQLRRLALHAWRLGFEHPFEDLRLDLRCPPSGELAAALAALGLPSTPESDDPAMDRPATPQVQPEDITSIDQSDR